MITIPGHETLHQIYDGRYSMVFKAVRTDDRLPVILKVLKAAYPTRLEILRYKQEYVITRGLTPLSGVIKVYGLEKYQNTLVMSLEDFGAQSLDILFNSRMPSIEAFLKIATRVTEIVGEIHSHDIIHKDINPSNIVMNSQTGEIKIIDFGIAAPLVQDSHPLYTVDGLEGTLPYLSPEQTGRMNRSVDQRTDYYSMGATFYQMLTARHLFDTTDSLEIVHCHIAKIPRPPHEMDPRIPRAISNIVMKLLAKNPEERYQSASGIKADLEECTGRLLGSGTIEPFSLGSRDIPERFGIPRKLYGRKGDIDHLMSLLDKARQGSKEMLLISGEAGIGKTSLVREIYRPITADGGCFAAGKFEQYGIHVPYSGVMGAFRDLILQILAESETRLEMWRCNLVEVLGTVGQVIIDVIPEVELIVGPQRAVPRLDPIESQNRFNHLMGRFVRLFCRPEHPLILFMDDLQWADSTSLKLLRLIMTDEETQGLLLIGAYREEENDSIRSLLQFFKKLSEDGVFTHHIELGALSVGDITELVSDTVYHEKASAALLAQLVYRKAAGNPFFTIEFLKSIAKLDLLYFDTQSGTWRWNLEQIEAQSITDNVVELMSGQISRLNQETQHTLRMAACIGNRFDLDTLAIVSEKPLREALNCIEEGVAAGLVLPLGNRRQPADPVESVQSDESGAEFKFAHDKIQQAAYQLIPDSDKPVLHQRAGRLLLDTLPHADVEGRIFEITSHLNAGAELARSTSGRHELARLNLIAGKKAKNSAAFEPAYEYFKAGLRALEKDSWTSDYDLALELHVEAAEAAYLCTAFDEMEQLCGTVMRAAGSLLDKVKAYEVMIQASIAQYKMLDAIERALEVLSLLGIHIPAKPSTTTSVVHLIRTKLLLFGKKIETLANLPKMTNPVTLAGIRIMSSVAKAAYAARPELAPMLVFQSMTLTLKYGNSPESAFIYASYGVILSSIVGDIDSGYRFGELALRMSDRLSVGRLKTRTLMAVNFFINPWKEHYRKLLDVFESVYESGLESGNLEDAALTAYICCTCAYRTGLDLADLDKMMTHYCEVIRRLKQESALRLLVIFHQAVLNLIGRTTDPCCLIGDIYDEEKMLPAHHQANDRSAICVTHLNKLVLRYLFEDYDEALVNAELTESYLDGIRGTPGIPVFRFYDSLVRLALCKFSTDHQRRRMLRKVARNQRKMKKWSRHGLMNHLHKYLLVEAERLRVLGKYSSAEQHYDRSIALANEHEYINEEALANELAAKHYLAQGRSNIARTYLSNACYCYERWGAEAKVQWLKEKHDLLLAEPAATRATISDSRVSMSTVTSEGEDDMDLAWVLRASQALSGEIVLERLLGKLMTSVIESAGAQKGLLIQDFEGILMVTAEASVDKQESSVLRSIPMEACDEVSPAIVHYVARTKENVVLSNAAEEGKFTTDPYIRTRRPKSILCTPLIYQGKLSAILYLENNLAAGTFTPNRLEVLQVLCSQAAISLDNAHLYERMEQLVAKRTAELQKSNEELNKQIAEKEEAQQAFLKAKLAAEAANRAKSDFLANMSHELRTPLNAIIGFAEMLEDQVFGQLTAKQLTHAGHIVRSGRHLLELINEILDLAKVEAGKMELNLGRVRIRGLLTHCATMIKERAQRHGIRLEVHVTNELSDAEVLADETKLKQVMFNLLSNAAKFTPDEGSIKLQAEKRDDEVIISVIDSGIGLKPEDRDRIFYTFEQAHSSQPGQEQGTGLGLTLSRRLIELHGGRIWVESDGLGKGCTFRFSLPFRPDTSHAWPATC